MHYTRLHIAATLLGTGAAVFPYGAVAQEARGADQTNEASRSSGESLDQSTEIVVTGITEAAQRAARAKRDAPNSIEVIEKQQLRQFNEQQLGDALRRLPGVTFDGANRSREVRLRGLPGEYTQVLIDGRPLIDGESRRSFEVDRIPSGLVERIEIVRAPRASQPGSGAAGTVNVILNSGTGDGQQREISVDGGYLEDNGKVGGFSVSLPGDVGPLSFNFAGSLQQTRRSESKDEFEFDENGTPDGGVLGINQRRFEQVSLVPNFALDMGAAGTFTLNPFYFFTKEFRDDIETELGDDQQTVKRVTDEAREREREAIGVRVGYDVDLNTAANLRLGFDYQNGRTDTERNEVRLKSDGTLDRTRQRSENIDLQRIRPDAVLSAQFGAHGLSFGVGANLQEYGETNFELSTKADGSQSTKINPERVFEINEDILFAFVEDVWAPTDNLTITGGLRLEDSMTNTTSVDGLTVSTDKTFLLPSVSAVYNLGSQLDLRAGIARTLRRPDLRTLTPSIKEEDGSFSKPDIQGNPNQVPESIWGLDFGLDYFFDNERGFVSLNLFARQFGNKIETTLSEIDGRIVATPVNVGDAEAYGVEVSGRLPLDGAGLTGLTLWGSGVYSDSSVDQPGGGTRRFLGQPDFVGTAGLDYELQSLGTTIGVAYNATSSVKQTQGRTGIGGRVDQSIDSRGRFDLSVQTKIARNTVISASATNLFAQTEDRVDEVFSAAGELESTIRTREPTYRSYVLRLTTAF